MVPGVTTPLAIPVRQLVEFACRSGDLAAGVPGPTASAGLRGHQQLQRSPPPGYRPEVRLSATVALDEFQVELKGGVAAGYKLCTETKLFQLAESLGGVESLIEHRASIEGPGTLTPQNLLVIWIVVRMLRTGGLQEE